MATTKVGVSGVGAAWAKALGLWVDFATGTYTSWAYTISILNSGYDIEITVGLSGGGTDTVKIQPMDTNWNDHIALTAVFSSPGWRAMPQTLLPSAVPGGTAIDIAFSAGPWAMRADMLGGWCNASDTANANNQVSGAEGEQFTIYRRIWKRGNLAYVDVIGIMWGTLSGLDSIEGMPTDFIGGAPTFISSGGGGSPDITPVVDAINGLKEPIEDISLMDVNYTVNNGAGVVSFRGRVGVASGS